MWLALGHRRDPRAGRLPRRRRSSSALFGATPEVASARPRPTSASRCGVCRRCSIVFAATGLLRGMQDTVTPLWIAGLGFGANALLNWLFIYGLGWGIARLRGRHGRRAVGHGGRVRRRDRPARPHGTRHPSVPTARACAGRRARAAGCSCARCRCASRCSPRWSSRPGSAPRSSPGWQVAFTIFSTAAFALDALAIAAQALIGKGLGAGDDRRSCSASSGRTVAWGAWFGVIVGAVIGALSGVIGLLFTGDAAIAALIQPALIVLAVAQPICGVVFVLDGVLIGAGDAKYLAIAGVLNLVPFVPALIARGGAAAGRRGGTRLARGRVLRRLHARAARDARLARPRRRLDDRRRLALTHTRPRAHASVRTHGSRGTHGFGIPVASAQRRHHSYITTAAAADALIERVEPYCVISTTPDAAASASGESPGPSCPNSSTHRSGRSARSTGTEPGTLSIAMIGRMPASAPRRRRPRRPRGGGRAGSGR